MWTEIRGVSYQQNGYTLVNAVQFPTWNTANGQDDIVWYDGVKQVNNTTWRATIDMSKHKPPQPGMVEVHSYMDGCGQANVFCNAVAFTRSNKTCSVSIGTTYVGSTQYLNVTTTGDANTNPGSDKVRTFIEKTDGTAVSGITYKIGANEYSPNLAYHADTGIYYYEIVNAGVTSVDSQTVSSTMQIKAPSGDYYVHCDVPSDIDAASGAYSKCSGNPFCDYEVGGGREACTTENWISCSNNDNAKYHVQSLPTVNQFILSTFGSTTNIPTEAGQRNHICQVDASTNFIFTSRRVRYIVDASNADGWNKVDKVEIRFGANLRIGATNVAGVTGQLAADKTYTSGNTVSSLIVNKSQLSATVTRLIFDVTYPEAYSDTAIEPISVYIYDNYGAVNIDNATNRSFKVWDCKPSVYGTVYDSSNTGISCSSNVGFDTPAVNKVNIQFVSFASPAGVGFSAFTDESASYTAANAFVWGKTYTVGLNPDTKTSDPTGRWTTTTNVRVCGLQKTINAAMADPYVSNETIAVDLALIRDQDPWFQVVGGNVIAAGQVNNNVPPTCKATDGCTNSVTVNTSIGLSMDNGLVAGSSITGLCSTDCKKGIPNDFFAASDLVGKKYGYDMLLKELNTKLGIGKVINGDATMDDIQSLGIGNTGVVFVNGTLDIGSSNALVKKGTYLIVVAKDTITVNRNVNYISGMFVTSGDFRVLSNNDSSEPGASDNQLVVEGMVYAKGDIHLGRGFVTASLNNSSPSVKVIYRPDFMFTLPSDISSELSNWQESSVE